MVVGQGDDLYKSVERKNRREEEKKENALIQTI